MENLNSTTSNNADTPTRQEQPQASGDAGSQTASTSASRSADASSSSQSEPSSEQANQAHPTHQAHPTTANNEPAPTTTLWENFMASLRNVVNRNPSDSASAQSGPQEATTNNQSSQATPSTADPQPNAQPNANLESSPSESAPSSGTAHQVDAETDSSSLPRPPVFFRLPFNGPDGNPALLAFHPQPLPQRDSDRSNSDQRPSQSTTGAQPSSLSQSTANGLTASQPSTQPSGNSGPTPANPHSFPHPEGHVPISPLFVPFGASPLPFSFIYDANTQTAWPIAQVTPGSPPGGPSPDAPASQQPRLVAGPPFRIILDIHFTAPPEPEQPSPEKAAEYVKQLERADAELRARMARLSMGSIGFADAASGDDQDALLGCGVCLDNYGTEDRPEWVDGQRSQDEAVVAVPCHGHHTLHAGCLRDWLAKLPPSQWTCPFCRAGLNPNPGQEPAPSSSPHRPGGSKSTPSAPEVVHTTLREEVRARERQRGWRCDAPACLPRYPASNADERHLELPETSDGMTTDLVKLSPCRHEVHLDCLCTSMRVENDLTDAGDLESIMSSEEDQTTDLSAGGNGTEDLDDDDEPSTVGKWVTCPACRKEGWAELPLRRKPQRSMADVAASQSDSKTVPQPSASVASAEEHTATAPVSLHTPDPDLAKRVPPSSESINASQEHTSDATANIADDEEAVVDAMLNPTS